eukprot:IDg22451t1
MPRPVHTYMRSCKGALNRLGHLQPLPSPLTTLSDMSAYSFPRGSAPRAISATRFEGATGLLFEEHLSAFRPIGHHPASRDNAAMPTPNTARPVVQDVPSPRRPARAFLSALFRRHIPVQAPATPVSTASGPMRAATKDMRRAASPSRGAATDKAHADALEHRATQVARRRTRATPRDYALSELGFAPHGATREHGKSRTPIRMASHHASWYHVMTVRRFNTEQNSTAPYLPHPTASPETTASSPMRAATERFRRTASPQNVAAADKARDVTSEHRATRGVRCRTRASSRDYALSELGFASRSTSREHDKPRVPVRMASHHASWAPRHERAPIQQQPSAAAYAEPLPFTPPTLDFPRNDAWKKPAVVQRRAVVAPVQNAVRCRAWPRARGGATWPIDDDDDDVESERVTSAHSRHWRRAHDEGRAARHVSFERPRLARALSAVRAPPSPFSRSSRSPLFGALVRENAETSGDIEDLSFMRIERAVSPISADIADEVMSSVTRSSDSNDDR